MKKDDDILTKEFRKRLENFELPVGGDVWARIERDLPPAREPAARILWVPRLFAIAACMLLLVGLEWYFSAVQTDVVEQSTLVAAPDEEPLPVIEPSMVIEPPIEQQEPKRLATNVVPTRHCGLDPQPPANTPLPADAPSAGTPAPSSTPLDSEGIAGQARNDDDNDEPPARRWEDAPIRRKKNKHPLTLALAYGNQRESPPADLQGWYSKDFSRVKYLFEEELPDNLSASSVHYEMPVAISFSLRKYFAEDWAYESGLTYTYLKSTETQSSPSGKTTSKDIRLHYIGVPLKLVFSFYDNSRLSLYASAGGMLEKCLSGNIPELQWSLTGDIGINYILRDAFSLFIEPGINYYFDDHSGVPTIRKDKPLNVGLQVGLRLTY
ncbi:hypothetical protein AGMMS49982_09230 [Bacteroidia bacterium]|nr:hypothetical protein AGMMS49982_09230 [Bacteroidia bacterium]